MGRWSNFLGRKTPELAIVPATQNEMEAHGELEDLQTELAMHQGQLNRLQEESAALGVQLGEVGALRAKLLVRLSEGSSNASAALDTLDRETLALQRARDGLALRMCDLENWIAPKQRHASELALIRDQVRQDREISELRVRVESITAEMLAHWREACKLAFDLMTEVDSIIGGRNLDPEHRHQALQINGELDKVLQAAAVEHVNGNWAFARGHAFRQLTVRPGVPKDQIARAG